MSRAVSYFLMDEADRVDVQASHLEIIAMLPKSSSDCVVTTRHGMTACGRFAATSSAQEATWDVRYTPSKTGITRSFFKQDQVVLLP